MQCKYCKVEMETNEKNYCPECKKIIQAGIEKIRRRSRDALNKTTDYDCIIKIAEILNVKMFN